MAFKREYYLYSSYILTNSLDRNSIQIASSTVIKIPRVFADDVASHLLETNKDATVLIAYPYMLFNKLPTILIQTRLIDESATIVIDHIVTVPEVTVPEVTVPEVTVPEVT